MRCLPAILPLKHPPPPLCRDDYQGAKVGSETQDQTRFPSPLLEQAEDSSRERALTQVTSGLSLWTILVLRGHTRTAHSDTYSSLLNCLDLESRASEVATNHNQDQLPREKGCMGYPTHPRFLHKALELTPSGPSAAQTMGTPVTQHCSS